MNFFDKYVFTATNVFTAAVMVVVAGTLTWGMGVGVALVASFLLGFTWHVLCQEEMGG